MTPAAVASAPGRTAARSAAAGEAPRGLRTGGGATTRIPPWLPDAITLARVALIPAVILGAEATRAAALAGAPTGLRRSLVVALLLVIGASDKLDGWLARRSGRSTTRRGALLDAGADRLVQWTGTGWFALRASPAFTPLPLWFPAVLLLRDATLFLVWLARSRVRSVPVEHELHGKAATVAVFTLVLASALRAPYLALSGGAAAVAALALYSTGRYALRTRRHALTMEEKDG